MNMGLNAAQARAKSSQDMIVFNECTAIMKAIIEQSANGVYDSYVVDNTTMTESTPLTNKLCAVNNPTVVAGNTIIINDQTIVLGTTGTNLNSIIADINDANVEGISATKDNQYLVLEIEMLTSDWTYEIGAGTANTALGLTAGTYILSDPASTKYFNTWQGTLTDRALQNQMDIVMKYFNNLGYKIERNVNTDTGKTFKWHTYW